MKKTSSQILAIIAEIVNSSELKNRFKRSKRDFQRTRKLPFETTLVAMMNFMKKSLSIEIHGFLKKVASMHSNMALCVTKSAFVQARYKILPEVFIELSDVLINEFYTDNELGVKLWKGLRLLAVDGSTINLPHSEELANKYGYAKNHNGETAVQSRCSVLYDVMNRIVLDGVLCPRKVSERTMAQTHFSKCSAQDLLIFDRGYYSYVFLHDLGKVNYLFRLKSDMNIVKSFKASGRRSRIVEINRPLNIKKADRHKYPPIIKIRLIRVELPGGAIEVLATSLTDSKKYPSKLFKSLYFERWKVETFYDELKNKLNVELFSGYSENTILQEFYAAIFISNVQSVIVQDIEDEIREKTKDRKYNYKVNTNLSYGFLKDRILDMFFSGGDLNQAISELKVLFLQHTVPIRPGRTMCRKRLRRQQPKRKVTKNHRDAI